MIVIIAALDQNHALGYRGQLLFHLKEDLRFFKDTTSGHPVIMGRKTWESLPKKLPGRQNIVVSHHPDTILPKPPAAPGPSSANNPPKHPTLTQTGLKTPENGLKTQMPDQIITDLPAFLAAHAADPDPYFIIGGASVYAEALPYAKTLFLTKIAASAPEADTYFPSFDPNNYAKTLIKKGSENGLDFTITRYSKL